MSTRLPPVPSREELRDHLVRTRIAGPVATPRENNLAHFRYLAERDRYYTFGLELDGDWTPADILELMAKRCGVNPDATYVAGTDTIDPDRTIDALTAMAERVGEAARRRERVLLATGHPSGLLPIYLELARALTDHGCPVLTPALGWAYRTQTQYGTQERHIRYVSGVAVLSAGGGLHHTHSPRPMEAILRFLRDSGEEWPDLVVADHGWAGAAGQAGIDTVGFADSNDPALFVGEAEGKVRAAVPLDDNVPPHYYAPLTAYLLGNARL
ncbi:MAG: phosphatase [Streptosporangiales bacterium]|nr:phosphatase [Streptosporangiales bacterium]